MDSETSVLVLVAAAVVGTYVWRFAGVLVAGHIKEGSPFFVWITCVAYAIAAGLMMKLLVLPTGALASTTLIDRLLSFALATAVFFVAKRRLVPALATGVVSFFVLLWI